MINSDLAFERWMNNVDAVITSVTGALASLDLSDFAYRDAFDEGQRPVDVAREVLEQNGFDTAPLNGG